jgi:hypothetical protein
MAVGAYFHADVAFVGGARGELVSAGADDVYFLVGRMNPGFHYGRILSKLALLV